MPNASFTVTYEIIPPDHQECCTHGTDHGFIGQDLRLRDAIDDLLTTRTSRVGGIECIEADEWPVDAPRWITVTNGMEFETGCHEQRSLHLPDALTPSTKRRIARLAGVSCA